MMENDKSDFPRQVELKKKLIICPKCGTDIEVDLMIDITPVADLIEAFGAMKNPKTETESDAD
jgi:hypothetical protein